VKFSMSQPACAEFLGTGFLVTAVFGSGIMGERLSNGYVAIALLANSIAAGAALVTLILTFGPISSAHFNPVVTLANALSSGLARADILPYILAQFAGGFAGTVNSHFMFG
jgi:glycerol uptake facilitator-like aquaporin